MVFAFLLLTCLRLGAAPRLDASFDPSSRRIEIRATGLDDPGYELRIETAGLRDVELGRDVGEPGIIYLPPREGPIVLTSAVEEPGDAENVFFFNDLASPEGWSLVACFSPMVCGTWKLNGRFSALGGEIQREVRMPASELERGENLLHLRSPTPIPPALAYSLTVPGGEYFTCTVTVNRANWRGRVVLTHPTRGEVASAEVAGPELPRREAVMPERWWQDRTFVAHRAVAVGRAILEAQNPNPRSLFYGGFDLVYDTQKEAYRMSHWIWAWGPTIKLLLDLEKLPAAKSAGVAPRFRAAAVAAGKKSLEFGMADPAHPAVGVSTVRWEPSRASPNGWVEYISTADSLFLAGWGWMSLYSETREIIYLERTKQLVAAAERLMKQYPVVPQDWVVERQRWTPHTLDESVFGMIGFTQLYAATESPEVADAGRRFLDSHLKHMGRESGLLERAWLREEDKPIWEPDIKGHAWVIEGYIDAYRFSGDKKYLQLARALAERVMECQREDGAWTYLFKRPTADDPIDDKGIAIWAYLFHELHRVTKDPRHLAAARRALGWCLRHQYLGEDPHLDGAVVNTNSMAYVRRRPMTILYTNTFFALALLEELKLGTDAR
jgi:hypothetical protein